MQSQQQSLNQITIEVSEPSTSESPNNAYVTYLIVGSDSKGSFSLRRRYNDFFVLRQTLVERWLGVYIPPIASKKITGNKEEKFVEERKRFLHYFCVKLAERPYLFYSQQFQLFLRGQSDFQKAVRELPPVNYQEHLSVYKQNFLRYSGKLSSAQLLLMNETDYEYLKKAEKKFDQIRQQFKEVAEAKTNYANQFVHVFGDVLPNYEQKFLLNHVGKDRQKLIMNSEGTKSKLKQYHDLANHNPLQDYVEMISYELREARALIGAVETRKKAEDKKIKMEKKRKQNQEQLQKLEAGKSNIKSVFSSGNKEQQIEHLTKETAQLDKQIEALNEMIPLMNAAGNHQIKEYKRKRGKEYVNVLKSVAEKQIKELSVYGSVLKVPLAQFK